MEQFYSIQGEGFHQGSPAYFIRIGGCDVGCTWCDVKESWDAAQHPVVALNSIVDTAIKSKAPICVITGGEPLMYDLTILTEKLKSAGKKIHLETSGAHPLSGTWDWICVSPKKFLPPLPEILSLAHELKIVVFNKSDFIWAQDYSKKVSSDCKLYLQPEWSNEKNMLPLIISYVKENPQWSISLQIHKYMNVP